MDESGKAIEETLRSRITDPASSSVTSSPLPSDFALLSSDAAHDGTTSPPSSPPRQSPSSVAKQYKSCFPNLKRKRNATIDTNILNALTEITSNTCKTRSSRPTKKARLTQMQIDLGGEIRKSCKECGMDYIPSNAEDAALHKEFHAMNLGGIVMGKSFLDDIASSKRKVVDVMSSGRQEESVVVIDRRASLAVKNRAKKVLDIVNTELSAIEIDDEMLWKSAGALATKKRRSQRGRQGMLRTTDDREDRFKVFLYLLEEKCIGLCLVERIHSALEVMSPVQDTPLGQGVVSITKSSSILTSPNKNAALLGISRLWTSKSHRRKGIATVLLDFARRNFFYGIEVPKEMVAFSQPSESGGLLAERWFGRSAGWHVYTEAG